MPPLPPGLPPTLPPTSHPTHPPLSAGVELSNADVLGSGWMENPKDEDGHYRLSWHLDEESVPGAGGWRAGHEIDLHEGTGDTWMKLMYFVCI